MQQLIKKKKPELQEKHLITIVHRSNNPVHIRIVDKERAKIQKGNRTLRGCLDHQFHENQLPQNSI